MKRSLKVRTFSTVCDFTATVSFEKETQFGNKKLRDSSVFILKLSDKFPLHLNKPEIYKVKKHQPKFKPILVQSLYSLWGGKKFTLIISKNFAL